MDMRDTITLRLIIPVITMAVLLMHGSPIYAGIPGSIWGKVEAQLPDGQRIPLPNVALYRTDWWRYDYCNQGGRYARRCKIRNEDTWVLEQFTCCFGDLDGVETYTGQDGTYTMSNDGNNPVPLDRCNTPEFEGEVSGAKRCLTGAKGAIPKTDDGRTCFATNWCGLNCGSNPHRVEPYLPKEFKLPGNLEGLGYTTNAAIFFPPFTVITAANDENQGPHDFTLMWPQSATIPISPTTVDIHRQSRQQQVALLTQIARPSPSPTPVPTGFLGRTNAEFEQMIAAWRNGQITTEQMSAFVTNLLRTPGLQTTICNPKGGGCELLP
jgi:hypothetical protein